MDLWANHIRLDFSRPGKPTDNAFIESFNGTFRSECLSAHWFTSIPEGRPHRARTRSVHPGRLDHVSRLNTIRFDDKPLSREDVLE